jgi:hypothetical protein
VTSNEAGRNTSDAEAKSVPPSITGRFEFVAKFAALLFGLVYAVGFTIISIHHAQFSISEFDPVKPKIFSTGLVFLLLAAAPILAAYRTFGLFGMRGTVGFFFKSRPENEATLKFLVGIAFYYAASALAWAIGPIFIVDLINMKPWGATWEFISLACITITGFLARRYFDKWPDTFVSATLANVVFAAFVTYRFENHKMFVVTLWFYGVGLLGLRYTKVLRDRAERGKTEWEREIPIIALVLLTYGNLIYKNITPYFGGGIPVPVMMYFSSKTPLTDSDSADVKLLEQAADGYYVLKSGDEKHAYFIRHDLVSAVHFGVPEVKPQ